MKKRIGILPIMLSEKVGFIAFYLYIILAPFSRFLPAMSLFGLTFNPVRPLGFLLILIAFLICLRSLTTRISKLIMFIIFVAILWSLRVINDLFVHNPMDVMIIVFPLALFFGALFVCKSSVFLSSARPILITIMLAGCLLAITAFLVLQGYLSTPVWKTEAAALFDRARAGSYADGIWGILAEISAFILFSSSPRKYEKIIAGITIPFSLMLILTTGFRTYLFLFVLVAFIFLLSRRFVLFLVLLGGSAIYFAFFEPTRVVNVVANRFIDLTTLSQEISLEWRRAEFETQVSLIKENPVWGYGPGMQNDYAVSFGQFGAISLYGHNLFLTTAATYGTPIALVILYLFMKLGILSIREARIHTKAISGPIAKGGAVLVGCIFVAGIAQNLLNMTISLPVFAFFFAPALQGAAGSRTGNVPCARIKASDLGEP